MWGLWQKPETFSRFGILLQRTEYLRRGTQALNRIRGGGFNGSNPSKVTSASEAPDGVWQLNGSTGEHTMTKTTKAIMAGAAFAGLLAGTSTPVRASNLNSSLKTSFGAQDQSQSNDQSVKEKHTCKGQNSCKGKGGCKAGDNGCKGKNSCKGKGGCRTDGKKPAENPPSA
jgi:hypothetical protein